jgi:hypothetical protein
MTREIADAFVLGILVGVVFCSVLNIGLEIYLQGKVYKP